MITHTPLTAGNLPIRILVVRQIQPTKWLGTSTMCLAHACCAVVCLPYDHPHPSDSRQFAYKNFSCWANYGQQSGLALVLCVQHTLVQLYAYPMIAHTPLIAGNLLIRILVVRQIMANKVAQHQYYVFSPHLSCRVYNAYYSTTLLLLLNIGPFPRSLPPKLSLTVTAHGSSFTRLHTVHEHSNGM